MLHLVKPDKQLDSTLYGACYAALGASSLLGASTSYGSVELIFLLPEGWMAFAHMDKGRSSSELVMPISKELMLRTTTKQPSIPKQCVFVVICNLPILAVQLFLFGTETYSCNLSSQF